MSQKENFFKKPEKKHVLGFGVLWLVGFVLVILATTDLFRESFYQTKNSVIGLIILTSAVAMFKLYGNYKD